MSSSAPNTDASRFVSTQWSSTLVLVTWVTALGGFLFGYDTAVINGANQFLKTHFQLTSTQQGLATASAILGCLPGALCAGFLSDRFGRRKLLVASAILFAASAVLSALPRTFNEFLIARWIGGLGIGTTSMVCPVYIAEIAPAARRGRLGSLFQLGIVFGIFLTLFINAWIQGLGDEAWNLELGWRWMLGSEVLPAGILLGLLAFAPESPRWLIKEGRDEEAQRVLSRMSHKQEAQQQIDVIHASLKEERGGIQELLSPRLRKPLLIAIVLMAASQFSGINVILYYSTEIFVSAGAGVENAFSASVWVGLVNLAFTFVAIAFVDRAGRKPLLLVGLGVQCVALGATGWMFQTNQGGLPLLLSVLAYIAVFAMALGPIPWIICSEIFPTRVRGGAMSIATFAIWLACYITIQTFPILNHSPSVGPTILFTIYATSSLLTLIFVLLVVPETKGRTLEEIANDLTGMRR